LVIAGFNISDELKSDSNKKEIMYKSTCLAIHFKGGSTIGNFTVPENMEIIVLLEEGMKQFLTPQNVELVKSPKLALKTYVENVFTSPLKT